MGLKQVFDIRQLKPFHRRAEGMPRPAPEKADEIAELDPGLLPEEQSYVNHYLGYADILLHEEESPTESRRSNVIELPRMQEPQARKNGNGNGHKNIA